MQFEKWFCTFAHLHICTFWTFVMYDNFAYLNDNVFLHETLYFIIYFLV